MEKLILADLGNIIGIYGLLCVGAIILVVFIVWLSNKTTGGRGVLYKFIQDYGYDDARTHDALEKCIAKIMIGEGYGNGTCGCICPRRKSGLPFFGSYECFAG